MAKIGGYKPTPSDVSYDSFSMVRSLVKNASTGTEYIIPQFTPIYDQGQTNTCVANATCGALEIVLGLQDKNSVVQLSRLFLYYNSKVTDKTTDKDDGTFIHSAFGTLKTLGVCPEDMWPFDSKLIGHQPGILCYKAGDDNKILNFYRIDSTGSDRVNDVEALIQTNSPVVFATEVSKEFENYSGGTKVFEAPAVSVGGHAMVIVGVRTNAAGKKEFRIRNSWGTSWGDNGFAWVSEDYLMSDSTSDLWICTRVNNITTD